MTRLPPHHIRRERLTDGCLGDRVVVIEAGAGYGKTTLAAELVDAWRAVAIEVTLLEGAVPPAVFAARLHSGISRAGFTEAAAAAAAVGEDPQGAVEAALAALASERCAFVIDDAQFADRATASLLTHLTAKLESDQRCIVCARVLPPGSERLRRAEVHQLSAEDLRLLPDETLRLCREGFGLAAEADTTRAVDEATGGWTAAAVLAASRARRTGEDLATVARAAGSSGRGPSSVAAILEEPLAGLTAEDRAVLAQVARLPLVDRGIVDAAAGQAGLFDRALAAGVPFTLTRDGWSDLPGPVRDLLAALAPAEGAVLRRAAEEYRRRGELAAALDLLVRHGFDDEAAGLLEAAPMSDVEALDALELRALVDRMSAEALEAHPVALLHFARCCGMVALFHPRDEALERVAAIASQRYDALLERALAVERAKDLVRSSHFADAEVVARGVLAAAGAEEDLTRGCARRARAGGLLARRRGRPPERRGAARGGRAPRPPPRACTSSSRCRRLRRPSSRTGRCGSSTPTAIPAPPSSGSRKGCRSASGGRGRGRRC